MTRRPRMFEYAFRYTYVASGITGTVRIQATNEAAARARAEEIVCVHGPAYVTLTEYVRVD